VFNAATLLFGRHEGHLAKFLLQQAHAEIMQRILLTNYITRNVTLHSSFYSMRSLS